MQNDGVQVHAGYQGGIKNRRRRALQRLEAQLKSGTKTEKVNKLTLATTGANQVPLTDSDRKRIETQILTLKSRV